ncbi:MAG: hypothetical protein GC146_03125 [Limimaricola sp.]|nr:hypothetical protein [Limimaricola sp.]
MPAERVMADSNGVLGGLIIGGLIGSAIANNNRRTVRGTSYSSATLNANRETQTALNYFDFPVGYVDGVLGRNSRTAIANYQSFLGYEPTGELTEYQRSMLVDAYHWASAGGVDPAVMAQGPRGVLQYYRDERTGAPKVVQEAPLPDAAPAADARQADARQADAAPALPNFMGAASAQPSLASNCNKVSLITNANGGFATVATMTDADFTLNEQFCLARTYAISQGEDLAAEVQGFTPDQIATQCASFGPAMKDEIAALSLQPRDAVLQQVSAFVLKTGMAPAQLSATARICLSVGYRTDAMDVAIGSALLLTALGEKPYAELIGHHLAEGFGTARRPDLAMAWYQSAFDALAAGTPAVFAPTQPDRLQLLQKAAFQASGMSSPHGSADNVAPSSVPVALPSFGVTTGQ